MDCSSKRDEDIKFSKLSKLVHFIYAIVYQVNSKQVTFKAYFKTYIRYYMWNFSMIYNVFCEDSKVPLSSNTWALKRYPLAFNYVDTCLLCFK